MTLDDVIPAPHFRERHERRITAPPEVVWAVLHELRAGDSPVVRALMGVRTLPARVLGRGRPGPSTGRPFLEQGPVPVLASDRPRSVVAGGVMQPWKLTGGAEAPVLDAAALRAFAEPGWVKCAVDFVLVPDGGGTRLSTETRVEATDRRTRGALRRLLDRDPGRLGSHPPRDAAARRRERADHGVRRPGPVRRRSSMNTAQA